jgi:hypothetical protein
LTLTRSCPPVNEHYWKFSAFLQTKDSIERELKTALVGKFQLLFQPLVYTPRTG